MTQHASPSRPTKTPPSSATVAPLLAPSPGYRTIAVHLKNHEATSEHIDVSIRIAKDFGAHLTGILTQREPAIFKKLYSEQTRPADRLEQLSRQVDDARHRFLSRASEAGVSAEFAHAEGDAAEVLGYVGRYYDLVVVEQTDLQTDEIGFDVPEHCLAATGRPVMVVPCRGSFRTVGRNVVIAWNGSREAALALHYALPFVANAERVTIIEGQGKERFPSVTRWPQVSVTRYLSGYARSFCCRVLPADTPDVGEAILWHAMNIQADLVILGAYGRSWLAEWVLGGATRHILRNARVPLLMAH